MQGPTLPMKQCYLFCLIACITSSDAMNYKQYEWRTIDKISFSGPTSCIYDKDNTFVIGLTDHKFITQHHFLSRTSPVFFEYKSPVTHIALSPAQKYVYGLSTKDPHCTKRLYTLWSLATKRILHQLERSNFYYHISPLDTYIITQEKGTIEIRDAQTSKILRTIKPIHDHIATLHDPYFIPSFDNHALYMAVAHTPSATRAVMGADQSRIIYLANGATYNIFGSRCIPTFSPDSKYIATATENDTVNICSTKYNTNQPKPNPFVILKYAAHSLTFTPNNMLIINSTDHALQEHRALKKEGDSFDDDDADYYPYASSLIIADPVSLLEEKISKKTRTCDFAINSCDGNRLCAIKRQYEYDNNTKQLYNALRCTILDPNTLQKHAFDCTVRKLYPAPFYMSPHGQYIVIPSYTHDIAVNATEKIYLPHTQGRYGNIHFSDDEKTIAYQPNKNTAVILKKYG